MKFFIYSLTVSLFYLSPALGKTKAETPPSSPSTIIDRFFSTDQDDIENWPTSFARTRRYNYPALNVTETDKTYVLEFEVPGYQKQNLNVSLIHRQLTLTGKREKAHQNKNSKKQHIAYQESMYGDFSRTITLPEDISQDNNDSGSERRHTNDLRAKGCITAKVQEQKNPYQLGLGIQKNLRGTYSPKT